MADIKYNADFLNPPEEPKAFPHPNGSQNGTSIDVDPGVTETQKPRPPNPDRSLKPDSQQSTVNNSIISSIYPSIPSSAAVTSSTGDIEMIKNNLRDTGSNKHDNSDTMRVLPKQVIITSCDNDMHS